MPKAPNKNNSNNDNNSQYTYYNKLSEFYYKHFHNKAGQFRQFALPKSVEQSFNTNWYQEYQVTSGDAHNLTEEQDLAGSAPEPIVNQYIDDIALEQEVIIEEEVAEEYHEEENEEEYSLLTPEMIEIFQHSQNWKLEKEKILQAEKEREEALCYVDKEDYLPGDLPSFEEYKDLYSSKKALTIASLESQLDNQFREACQSENPALWPILPLNLKFN
ncbi:hypothetical protein CONCODRAFT_13748 [Conidiobolus coronatus NRRL 28638]|uniref:Uncharacterized protein n=1 Tax=Conidiobolus coronatus (strain ATCC 28846 / CBS 209.66 / NRRL 28638) TaxID=796925 RepID=A0A137NQ48_CONC2|nr:hypothetical protein CONCODRAFT_13748 [Conidiobolus coronatus NRRL 28638]|eukprot:KXN64885.1 hypothetical protein CONCODRAFT_13748 [Conidiobolus coronatus NRRL 28638]